MKVSLWFALLALFATLSLSAEEERELDIDFSPLPVADATADQQKEYMQGVLLLYMVFPDWKDSGVSVQLDSMLPWLTADKAVSEKWTNLAEKHKYKILPMPAPKEKTDRVVVGGVDLKTKTIHLNFAKGTYLREDPAFVLVPIIVDVDFMTIAFDAKGFPKPIFQKAVNAFWDAKENAELRKIYIAPHLGKPKAEMEAAMVKVITQNIIPVWKTKRNKVWQMEWYGKARKLNPLVRRPMQEENFEAYTSKPADWKAAQISDLLEAMGEDKRPLVEGLWNYKLPEEFDMPKP